MKKYITLLFTIFFLFACSSNNPDEIMVLKYRCGKQVYTVSYLEDNNLILRYNDKKYFLENIENPPEAIYEGAGIKFWNMRGDTYLRVDDSNFYKCMLLLK